MRLPALLLASTLLAPGVASASPLSRLVVDYEAGPLYVFRNDERYGAAGTLFEADEVGLQSVLFVSQRPTVELGVGERHAVFFTFVPLRLETRSTLGRDITFNDATFLAGTPIVHRYQFDGYRGSYAYRLLSTGTWKLDAGVNLQIRSAEVSLASQDGALYSEESDIGPVPALKLRARHDSRLGFWAQVELDGLSTFGLGDTDGGLLDAALTLGLPVRTGGDFFLRLRLYGGGADVSDEELLNFGWYGSATLGMRADLLRLFD